MLYKEKNFNLYDFESYRTCESCLMGKMTKTPFTRHGDKMSDILGLVHIDVQDLISTQARERYSYFIIFTYDLSRFGYVYLLKYKFEAFDKFKEYQRMIEK